MVPSARQGGALRLPLILVLVPILLPLWAAEARAPWDITGGLMDAAQEPPVPCSCDCCQVSRRTPAEMAEGATQLKCIDQGQSPRKSTDNAGQELDCPASCALGLRAKVMTNIETDSVLYSQFCFLECRPFDVVIGSACVGITTQEADAAATPDGTGQDIHVIPVVQQPPTVMPPLPPPLADQLLDGMDGGASMSAPPIQPAPPEPSPAEEKLDEGADAMDAANALQDQLDADAASAAKAGDKAEENAIAARGQLKEGWPESMLLSSWRRTRRGFLPGRRFA